MKSSGPGPLVAGCEPQSGRLRIGLGQKLPVSRQFHVREDVRIAAGLSAELFGIGGNLLRADLAEIRRLAGWLGPEGPSSAELFAAMASHEVLHLLLVDMRAEGNFALEYLVSRLEAESDGVGELLAEFARVFPPGTAPAGDRPPLETIEEILLLHLHNRNRAMRKLKPLLHDTELGRLTSYQALAALVARAAAGEDQGVGPEAGLLEVLSRLLAPQLASPDSLLEQLELLGRSRDAQGDSPNADLVRRLLLAADLLREEQAPRFSGQKGPPVAGRHDLLANSSPLQSASDENWMQSVVMIAKSCLVWLDQLSERHGSTIATLDRIPDSELAELAASGFNALWLIGIWQRSEASRIIKQRRGQPDALASAYAVHDYVIDSGLGGEEALQRLKQRAERHGLRLVSDMVPNHSGIDSRWVVEHPDWFIQVPEPPFPAYSFAGPELGAGRVGIRLEDHYWDGSDAAVVFERTDHLTGERRYLYHGNDGTGLPWNDTAQLDYLKPEVRAAVIDTMVAVAKRFPIIRFDAAMTLVRRHIQRLWYPPPGEGGAIASRAEHGAMTTEEFAAQLPDEFWLEATGRLEREAPGTLLLAEAFWMLEGYFVRNLGMHRVYNSAFMHMLRDEANAEFRDMLRRVQKEDRSVLGRLVNFMNNPDEESALEQFGSGDKYFGVCTLLATLPGLPMFGHGQVEGLSEKYGMEFRRARLDEQPLQEVVRRHQAEIFPLLRRRQDFADPFRFELYDFHTERGVNEDVIAFSNRAGLVLYNNSAHPAAGSVHRGVDRGAGAVDLLSALVLAAAGDDFIVWRDHDDDLEYLRPAAELQSQGLFLELAGYSKAVLLDFRREAEDAATPLGALAAALDGRGVPDVLVAARGLAWQGLADWLGGLGNGPQEQAEPVLPAGKVPGDLTLGKLQDRAARLRKVLAVGELKRAWELLDKAGRVLVLSQGLVELEGLLPYTAPELPEFLRRLPWRHDPAWWDSGPVREWLGFHSANGERWFLGDQFDWLAAIFALRGALRAGEAAGAELWSALQAAQKFSGWHPERLAVALGGSSGG